MAEVVLFHHIRGVTPGIGALADAWRAQGHVVHVPDLFEGQTFDSIEAGSSHVEEIGFPTLLARAEAAVGDLTPALVYAGISMGAVCAEYLALTRRGARGVLMLESAVPAGAFVELGGPEHWPEHLAFQIHGMDGDPFFAGEGDIDVARELVAAVPDGELFVYPGGVHLFCDASLPAHDPGATARLSERVLAFLDELGS